MTNDPTIQTIKMSELINSSTQFIKSYFQQWKRILLLLIVGFILSIGYYFIQKPKYEAEATFVLEEKSQGLGGGLSGLASQFGIDIGSVAGSSGLFAGDNILDIIRSRKIIEKVLLTKATNNSTLADLFKVAAGYDKKWESNNRLKDISFANYYTDSSNRRVQDSVPFIFYQKIINKHLSVDRLSKKGSIIQVITVSRSDIFSKLFTERVVAETMRMYVEIKTSVASKNIQRLEQRSDSLLSILNNKSYQSAAVQILDANVAFKASAVPVELSQREKSVTYALYTEVMKNLEAGRMALSNQTPVINLLDSPKYPLENNNYPLIVLIGIGLLSGIVVSLAIHFITYDARN